ncbi:4Fe-4S binding protein [Desulfosporosinus sp. OT]|uniref:4Fe-4S binding protein n=1 Tax=Desulfosporosinus sp. OT TaxID=913865 RepID=UPI000223AD71|nr:4Fe-4S binding protein [Desulfosporosinus sp. OT]EGW39667.1 4Fe-4S binding domain protein [Desulfosporosinus sp. OT]
MFARLRKHASIRHVVQILFAIAVAYIGITFVLFVDQVLNNSLPSLSRPAGVEAFLPISALVGLKAWIATGVFDPIHPAGLMIFLAAIAVSLLFKRAFCSWICPIGTLSEGLAMIGRMIFGRNFRVPKVLDYFLRSLKYIILFFFVMVIFFGMSGAEATAFLQTPYNMVSDVKMLKFVQHIGTFGMTVIGLLVMLSIIYENFWCRYLCPYGGLLGLFSILSPFKVTRNLTTCIGCGKCTKSCPNHIQVEQADRVWSPECTGCLNCIQQCPVKETLEFKAAKGKRSLSPKILACCLLVMWAVWIIIAKSTGHWETHMTMEMYRGLIPMVDQIGQ